MDYILALKLKKAGFPQIWPKPDFMDIKDAIKITDIYNRYPNEIDPYRPTLSELIEACKEDFHGLNRLAHSKPEESRWQARGVKTKSTEYKRYGDSPEEAVAHLYLALNNK